MLFKINWFFIWILLVFDALAIDDFCRKFQTCNECIRNSYKCSWCSMDGVGKGERCRSMESNVADWCSKHLINPKSSKDVVDNRSFSEIVQIKPQKYKLKLRPEQAMDFHFSYKETKDYPVDMYFLIDASKSMSYIRSETAKQSENIYYTISNMTNNLSLGMGTFIDKNAIPFVSVKNSSLCYSFKHHLNLTASYEALRDSITEIQSGDNFDRPEGGLDALAQVLLCNNKVGWRNESRKIILFLTDAPYHAAGDGKLAGISKPFDGNCYLKDGMYLKELEMDYPSVSMINKLANDRGVTIIFAIKEDVQSTYAMLSSVVRQSRVTTYDSSDMALILKNIYMEITKNIKIKKKHENNINITLNPDCTDETNTLCAIKTGQVRHFNGTVKLLEYVQTNTLSIDLIITGTSDKLTLEIDVIKDCDCSNDYNSVKCNKSGNYRCGICECNANRYGDECQCNATSSSKEFINSTCIASDNIECSNHGFCHCGTCICRSPYEGEYCQYDYTNCKKTCHNGACIDGKCICRQEWTGEDCDCSPLKASCTIGNNVCNNRGDCKCGECICHPPQSVWDARINQDKFCRLLPGIDTQKQQCWRLENCALCHHVGNVNCAVCDEHLKINVTETFESVKIKTIDGDWHTCHIKANVWCNTYFMYRYEIENYGVELLIPLENDCIQHLYWVGGAFLIATVLIGLGTLIAWKLLTDFRDRQEYRRFVKDRDASNGTTQENPYYLPSTTEFTNVAYNGND